MRNYRLTPRAEASIRDIFRWTATNFGRTQAASYRDQLLARCTAIALGRIPSRSCRHHFDDELAENLPFVRAGSHFVILVETEEAVLVVDFLHQAADIAGRLADPSR